jgi:UDP-galactopyranose mutase
MNTFNRIWDVITPNEAKAEILKQQSAHISETPNNLEEQAIHLVGTDIYEKLIKGYTEKQWDRPCDKLPAFIIKRLPVRFSYDNNFYYDRYQGIPIGGYTRIIERMLCGSEVVLNTDYLTDRKNLDSIAGKIIFTGTIDSFFNYCFGELEYRSLRFETEHISDSDNYQGIAVMNYTDRDTPFTRIIEHKHFEFGTQPGTVITREYPSPWSPGIEEYYPINDAKNSALYSRYKELADKEKNIIFGGRLGEYRYYDMDKVIESSLRLSEQELG